MFGIILSAGHLRVSLLTALVNTFSRCGCCSTDLSALGQYVFGDPNAPIRYTTYFQKVQPSKHSKPYFWSNFLGSKIPTTTYQYFCRHYLRLFYWQPLSHCHRIWFCADWTLSEHKCPHWNWWVAMNFLASTSIHLFIRSTIQRDCWSHPWYIQSRWQLLDSNCTGERLFQL